MLDMEDVLRIQSHAVRCLDEGYAGTHMPMAGRYRPTASRKRCACGSCSTRCAITSSASGGHARRAPPSRARGDA